VSPNRIATDEQCIAALKVAGGKIAPAARALGMSRRALQHRMPRLAKRGWSPLHDMTKTVPDGFAVKGVSSLYDADGNLRAQWVKSNADHERRLELLREVIAELAQDVRGLAEPVSAPKRTLTDSLSAYLIGDAHFGLYAWDEEAGENFDTAIASADLRAAIDLLVAGSPDSDTGWLVDVGDLLHADSRVNATPASGNALDTDSRFPRVIRIAVAALRYCIGRMLLKHGKVKVFITPGNHNPNSAGWLAMVLAAYYERDRRVTVELSPAAYFYERFGKVLVGITHGDKTKLDQLPAIMATDRPQDWGQTQHRYWWTGHIHHTKHQEYRGCFVESFNTLAASDAWHASNGYRSARQMQRIDLDREHGIYSRGIANIGMIRKRAA
jgi:hypothetical protein